MSNEYRHVLVAVDLTKDSHKILERALQIADRNHAKLSIMHTLEPLGFAYGGDIPMDLTSIQDQLDDHAKQRLAEIADAHVARDDQHVVVGMPDTEIHRFADEHDVDLIVVGSHGRHGFALLLGSTSTGVLHGAQCDVLAVRVGKESEE
ncbi:MULTISPECIES: universal stress protein [Halomonas]|uniref:Universal stress protein n=3 Tax=Halomonas TaxID=2745 RepID=A0AAU7KFB9_9GAMM|nr:MULTISPECIES: universal stress protein [Halomonas]MBR9771976.1 universal stress protein [Gammaproteobacteria bacterium]MCO7214255.1 universal stress protein [Halomonas sp. OfavH-34-E]KJZ14112.1 universal stress protein UspA [Halomonas sp. S2151]MAR70730.1 universal stress protein [Halomonas sp.]MBR9880511.1 universal stress protein [Gammaproteobacteria bacterium]